MGKIKIKICGITREDDIQMVNLLRPDYIGFVFAKSRRQISKEWAVHLRSMLLPNISTVGVFVEEDPATIIRLLEAGIIDIAQLHGNESEKEVRQIQNQSRKPVIKAVSVQSRQDIDKWKNSSADLLLFDSATAGCGKTFYWPLILGINRPFFLAGGICKDNLHTAMEFGAFGLDISSGVESEGVKDYSKIQQVISQVRNYYK